MQILHDPGHLGAHRVEDGRWRQNCVFVGLKFKQLGGGAGRGSLRKRIQNYLFFFFFKIILFLQILQNFDCVNTLLGPLSGDRHRH